MQTPRANNSPAKIGVITATCGNAKLAECIRSVARQKFTDFHHYIVPDGPEYIKSVEGKIPRKANHQTVVQLPERTGESSYNGHRIYGALPFLINTEYVCYLDEDNTFTPDHLQTLVDLVEGRNLDWAYSLRSVMGQDGCFICRDDCDSLGIWGSWPSAQHHIDTNCYLIRRSIAIELSSIWNRPGYSENHLDPDKAVCRWLLSNRLRGFTTGKYTVKYRLGSSSSSAQAKFYQEGNRVMRSMYRYFPWRSPILETVKVVNDYRRIVARHESLRPEILRRMHGQGLSPALTPAPTDAINRHQQEQMLPVRS